MIFGQLILGGFGILMSNMSQVQNIWGYLGSQSLQYGAVTLFCHNPETKEYFAPETYWTSKYQNLPIFGFQKSLGLCSF